MRLPFCPTRSPDVPEGVVGRFVPPDTSPVREELAEVFCLAAELELDGVASPLLPLPVCFNADAVCLGEAPAAVCLGDAPVVVVLVFEALAAVVLLAFLTGVVGIELRP